jgi:hypothetical protein
MSRIAAIKAGDKDGFFFQDAVLCAFMWAGKHHMDVTNNSYFADPWLYNCLNDPVQLAIWTGTDNAWGGLEAAPHLGFQDEAVVWGGMLWPNLNTFVGSTLVLIARSRS